MRRDAGEHRRLDDRCPLHDVRAVCFDWGGTLMTEDGPEGLPMTSWPVVQAVEGAEDCLRQLEGRVPLAIATNATHSGRDMIVLALERVGLRRYFDHVFCFAEIGFRKGDPEFWEVVSRGLGVPLARIAMVGDSWEQDALLPRRFGVQAVWFAGRGAALPASPEVPVVRDLALFARWVLEAAVPGNGE
jgi:FMN phosphatase YigB (HAD superfamily)